MRWVRNHCAQFSQIITRPDIWWQHFEVGQLQIHVWGTYHPTYRFAQRRHHSRMHEGAYVVAMAALNQRSPVNCVNNSTVAENFRGTAEGSFWSVKAVKSDDLADTMLYHQLVENLTDELVKLASDFWSYQQWKTVTRRFWQWRLTDLGRSLIVDVLVMTKVYINIQGREPCATFFLLVLTRILTMIWLMSGNGWLWNEEFV